MNNERQIFQLVQLPPAPTSAAPNPLNDALAGSSQYNDGSDTRSTDARMAFGRHVPP